MPASILPQSPILIFDSGVGGLSILREVRKVLPEAPIIYAADNAGLPYGTKTEAQIAARVAGLLGRMTERYRPRLVCIACNTASTIALGMVREVLEVPVVGTVPAIRPAAIMTKSGVVGLLGTEATIRQAYVDQLEHAYGQGKRLLRAAAPELVSAAEYYLRGGMPDPAIFDRAAQSLLQQKGSEGLDTVVLACTHFPLVQSQLAQAFGPNVRFICGAQGIARRIQSLTDKQIFQRLIPDTALFTKRDTSLDSLQNTLTIMGLENLEIL